MADRTVVLEFQLDVDESVESINTLTAANKKLREERNKLNLTNEEGKKRAQEINAAIDQNTSKIKANVSAIEKQKINIGNYKSALDGVHPALGKVGQGLEQGYWKELFKVSRNHIVWGGNYFGLPAHRCFIVWDKMTYVPTMSQVEMAWTSFDGPARYIQINSNQLDRVHPTQKPVKLYKWLLTNYAKPGNKILDTHLGSQSSRIAAYDLGFDFYGWEIDKDYFEAGNKRFEQFKSQLKIF